MSKPSVVYTHHDIANRFVIKTALATYHVQNLFREGAIRKVSYGKYQANPEYKSVEQIREEIKVMPIRVQQGQDWKLGDTSNPIQTSTTSGMRWFRRQLAGMEQRVRDMGCWSEADWEAWNELLHVAGLTETQPT